MPLEKTFLPSRDMAVVEAREPGGPDVLIAGRRHTPIHRRPSHRSMFEEAAQAPHLAHCQDVRPERK
jgi:hypothetical protein